MAVPSAAGSWQLARGGLAHFVELARRREAPLPEVLGSPEQQSRLAMLEAARRVLQQCAACGPCRFQESKSTHSAFARHLTFLQRPAEKRNVPWILFLPCSHSSVLCVCWHCDCGRYNAAHAARRITDRRLSKAALICTEGSSLEVAELARDPDLGALVGGRLRRLAAQKDCLETTRARSVPTD